MKIRVEITVYHVPTKTTVGTGIQWLDTDVDFDQLKDLLSSAVRGKLAFLKLSCVVADSETEEIFIGRDILMKSKISIKRCVN